jgi:hypothetical protein
VKRDNALHSEMETFDPMMPVTMDEGDIGERSNDRHDGPSGWHHEIASARNNTQKRGWGLKHVHSATVLCVLV